MQDQFLNLYKRHSVSAHNTTERPNPQTIPRKLPQENYQNTLHKFNNNEWMKKHGKGDFIDFNSKQRAKIRQIFKQLDKDGSNTLSADELYAPLLALGLVENKAEVLEMMKKVDTNSSGVIEFEEFIKIIKTSTRDNNTLISFFKDLTDDKIFSDLRDLPFSLILLTKRRELMMQGYLGKNNGVREHGKKIINAWAEELKNSETISSKQEKFKAKQENKVKDFFERQNCIRTAVMGVRETRVSLNNFGQRPGTASRKPMTRRDVLNLY